MHYSGGGIGIRDITCMGNTKTIPGTVYKWQKAWLGPNEKINIEVLRAGGFQFPPTRVFSFHDLIAWIIINIFHTAKGRD